MLTDFSLNFMLEQNINDMICSLDYKNCKAEIKTADAQQSYKDGVIVLVTGYLTGKDNMRKQFTQTFFLAPQDKGYFVLNDVLRYTDQNETDNSLEMVNGVKNVAPAPLTHDPGWIFCLIPQLLLSLHFKLLICLFCFDSRTCSCA